MASLDDPDANLLVRVKLRSGVKTSKGIQKERLASLDNVDAYLLPKLEFRPLEGRTRVKVPSYIRPATVSLLKYLNRDHPSNPQ